MPRPIRLEYPGALYHVTCRTNRGEPVFGEAAAAAHFLEELGAACTKTGWRVHAWCLLPDHAHVVLETPQPNLVSGMKWWLGTFTHRYNRRRGLSGHLFAGRYRAVAVAPDGPFFLEACLHALLNPARAGLLPSGQALTTSLATSAAWCVQPPEKRPAWFVVERLFAAAGLSGDSAEARRTFAELLESRRVAPEPDLWRALRRGWCFGDEAFRAELLARLRAAAPDNRRGPVPPEAQVQLGRMLVAEELARRGWTAEDLVRRRKTDPEKVAIARRLRRETTLSLRWIAAALHMGSSNTLRNCLVAVGRGTISTARKTSPAPRRVVPEASRPNRAPGTPKSPTEPVPPHELGPTAGSVSKPRSEPVQSEAGGPEGFSVTWD